MRLLLGLLIEEDGPTAVEYSVMLALILLACVATIGLIGTNTQQMMDPNGQLSGALRSGS